MNPVDQALYRAMNTIEISMRMNNQGDYRHALEAYIAAEKEKPLGLVRKSPRTLLSEAFLSAQWASRYARCLSSSVGGH